MNWRTKADKKFEQISDFIYDNRLKIIFIVLLFVFVLASNMKYLKIDTSTEGFLHKEDIRRIEYNKFRDQFGRDEKVLIAIQTKDIFNKDFLNKLNRFHHELEDNVPYIEDVNSLINSRNTYGTQDALIVEDLFDDGIPTSQKEIDKKKKLAQNNPLLKDLVFNTKGTITTILIDTATYTSLDKNGKPLPKIDADDEFSDDEDINIQNEKREFLSDWENEQIVKKVNEIAKKYESDDFKILVSGTAVINAELKSSMQKDMQKFIKLVVLIIAILLGLLFRRISGILLPLFVVALTIISSLSLMAIFNAPITVVTQILPSFLLAVMIGASIHLLSIFFKEFNITKDKRKSLRYALGHSGLAIVMTSLTTAAGLWSFSFSQIAPVADLGKFASAGVLIGLIFTLILLPALISLIRLKPKNIVKDNKSVITFMDKMLVKIADISVENPKLIIVITSIIILISLFFVSQLKFSHKPIIWFDKNHPVRVATNLIDKELKGSVTLEIVIDTHKENGLYDPKILNAIDNFSQDILTIKNKKYFVGKTLSLTDIIKETNKALNDGNKKDYIIPQDKNLIAQELLLFENSGSDDLEDWVDSGFTKARITVKLPYIDAIDYIVLLKQINQYIKKDFKNLNVDVTTTGISNLLAQIMQASIISSAKSYVIAILLITIMMIILIGDVKIGLISMIPNIAPILIMSTVMVIFNMPLDMFTMLIGSIAIGLAVDDTVHFMYNFKKYEQIHHNVKKATQLTLLSTGRAMIVTSIVLSAGFLVFTGASMSNIYNFGILTAIAIITALLADFFLVPAIMAIIYSKL